MPFHKNTLIIGLGGTGGRVLRDLRKRMFDEGLLGESNPKLPLAFMYIDSSDELMRADDPQWLTLDGHDARFTPSEFLNIKVTDPDSFIEHLDQFPLLKEIVGNCDHQMFKHPGNSAMQNRRLGRFLFAANANAFTQMLQKKVEDICMTSGNKTDLHVYIVTGLAGGTGSGAIIDVIVQTIKYYPDARICVLAAMPKLAPPSGHDTGHYLPNVYAALRELNALNVGAFQPLDITSPNKRIEIEMRAPFLFTLLPFESNNFSEQLYSLLLPPSDRYEELMGKTLTFETSWDVLKEYNSTSNEQKVARTKALVSITQKRILHPLDMILRRTSYTIVAQSLNQMLSNHYIKRVGYVDENVPIDDWRIIIETKLLRRWYIDEEALTLQRPLPDMYPSKKAEYINFVDYWNHIVDTFNEIILEEKNNDLKKCFNTLKERLWGHYDLLFRQLGVKEYYRNHCRLSDQHAKAICNVIESDLYQRWHQGEYGMHNLVEIVTRIIRYLNEKRESAYEGRGKMEERVEELKKEMEQIQAEYDNLCFLRKHFSQRPRKIYENYVKCQKDYYISLTDVSAQVFKMNLIEKLIPNLELLHHRLGIIAHKMSEMKEQAEKVVEEIKHESIEHHDLNSSVVDVSDDVAVQYYINMPVSDSKEMEFLSWNVRESLIKLSGERNDFLDMDHYLQESDVPILAKSISKFIKEHYTILDDQAQTGLYNPYSESTLTALFHRFSDKNEQVKEFADGCIDGLGESLHLDQTELTKTLANNLSQDPRQRSKTILISLPNPKTDDEEAVLTSIREILRQVSINVEICESYNDEITITQICKRIPIRAFACLPLLKQQYDQWTNQNKQYAIDMLHIEDKCSELPSLEIEKIV